MIYHRKANTSYNIAKLPILPQGKYCHDKNVMQFTFILKLFWLRLVFPPDPETVALCGGCCGCGGLLLEGK